MLHKGFRPFFLLGALFVTLGVPLWLVALHGGLTPGCAFGSMQWHAHEMLFGFTTAIIAGFLLTAAGNWSGRETATGVPLAGLAGLWVLGRFAVFFSSRAPHVAAVLDVAFLPALALVCAAPLVASRSRRNYGFIGLLLALALLNGAVHGAALRHDVASVRAIHVVTLDVILLVIVSVTGRVVPLFTRNATGIASIAGQPLLERASLVSVAALALSDAAPGPAVRSAVLAALAGGLLLLRMRRWGSWHARRDGLLWILHLGTAWIPIGLLLRAGAAFTPAIPAGSALHALTAGAIGSLTLGMMARVSLGHTGRTLQASRLTNVAFACVALAGGLRVFAPLSGALYLDFIDVAGGLWSGAFGLFFVEHARMLASPRVDGRPG